MRFGWGPAGLDHQYCCPPLSDNVVPSGVSAMNDEAAKGNPRMLRGTELRYTLVRLLQVNGPSTVAELLSGLQRWGFTVGGRPSKTVSDALRWENRRDRVRRLDRGLYRAGQMPRSTEHRIICRVESLRRRPSR